MHVLSLHVYFIVIFWLCSLMKIEHLTLSWLSSGLCRGVYIVLLLRHAQDCLFVFVVRRFLAAYSSFYASAFSLVHDHGQPLYKAANN